ncbi:MAG: tubulin-like doman-containing protein [Eubacteriaceae bacterium]|nr:tubulin-like doman-containing protein [Eubacteriaceae bacterium]
MPLTQDQRTQISENMKVLESEGFIQRVKRTVTNTKDSYLIVGLGGTGCNALAEVKNELSKVVDDASLQKYARFLAIDSARSDLEQLVRGSLLGEDEILVLPHENALARVANPTPAMAQWLNPQLKNHADGGLSGIGAGNRRQCGRVLLCGDAAIAMLQAKVKACFVELVANINRAEINLIVLAGIAGGTGSGTVIDATYIISQILSSQNNAQFFNASYGFIFLPPASSDEVRANTDIGLATGNSNGYAALKEIEYHMTLSSRDEAFMMDYGNFHVNQGDLFRHCFLIDGHGGAVLNSNPRTVAARTAASCIVNIIASEQSQAGVADGAGGAGGQTSSLLAALSNVPANQAAFILNSDPQYLPRDTHYKFIATGYSECLVPTDLLALYAAKKVFDQMYSMYIKGANADKDAALDTLGELGLNNAGVLLERISNKVHVGIFADSAQVSAAIYDAEEGLRNEVEKAFNDKMDDIFKKSGPYYLANLSLEIGDILNARSTRPADAKGRKGLMQEAIGRIFKSLAVLALDINRTTWEVYTAVIDELKKVFDETETVFTQTVLSNVDGTKRYHWTPIGSKENAGLKWIDSIMDEAAINQLVGNFKQGLLDNKNLWARLSRDREFNASAFVRDFIQSKFDMILKLNLGDFVAKCYSGKANAVASTDGTTPSDDLRTAAKQIATNLYDFGDILAQIRNPALFSQAPKKYVLILPESTSLLNGLIEQQLRTLVPNLDVYHSLHSQSFTLFSSHFSFPLEQYTWVADGERAYARFAGDDVIGRHLYEASINWRSLPNLINQDNWSQIEPGYVFAEERTLAAYMAQMLETARRFGLVTPYSNLYSQYQLLLLDDKENRNLATANVAFIIKENKVERENEAENIYKVEANRLFGLLDSSAVYDISQLESALPEGTFRVANTRPHSMPMQDGMSPRNNFEWIYTGKFLRKMYNTCISLERTLGVMAQLRKLVEENNSKLGSDDVRKEAELIKKGRIQVFANYYGAGLVDYNTEEKSWLYIDYSGNENELLSELELFPWQRPYHYYYMMKKYMEMPGELFEYWQEQYEEIIADRQKRASIPERQQALLAELKEAAKGMAPLSFVKTITGAQPDGTLPAKLREFYSDEILRFGG